jgi:hypothetical protein
MSDNFWGKTQGELWVEEIIREARWKIIRRRIYMFISIVAVVALVIIAIKV